LGSSSWSSNGLKKPWPSGHCRKFRKSRPFKSGGIRRAVGRKKRNPGDKPGAKRRIRVVMLGEDEEAGAGSRSLVRIRPVVRRLAKVLRSEQVVTRLLRGARGPRPGEANIDVWAF
jgi:hypothetical protein